MPSHEPQPSGEFTRSRRRPSGDEVEFVAETLLPTDKGRYRVRAYRDHVTGTEPLAIAWGPVEGKQHLPVRVHDECLTSEVLGSLKCDCRDQLDHALEHIRESGCGLVIYLRQEGRGIGLANKIAAYALQQDGLDTVDANRALGLPDDARRYHAAAAILDDLGIESVSLLTNNPRKVQHLESLGIVVSDRIPSLMHANPHSEGYLHAKAERMGHLLDEVVVGQPLRVASK
ncbi:MAG: GTP cyclohydrolase II [Myxococcales bacterium]|nr:GTP cyclohydrolase II [Myxococcales bacterium]